MERMQDNALAAQLSKNAFADFEAYENGLPQYRKRLCEIYAAALDRTGGTFV